jgi:urease accessory protein
MIMIRALSTIAATPSQREVPLTASRRTLAKKLWRGVAADGTEFGFELNEPLPPDTPFHAAGGKVYVARQEPEPVLAVRVPDAPDDAARLGWTLGNLHTPVQVDAGRILIADEPGLRKSLERLRLGYAPARAVFRPTRAGHDHHDEHEHSHEHPHEHPHGH